jgi:CheY-like chemotaxis protein
MGKVLHPRLPSLNVLLVDDDGDVRAVTKETLEFLGLQVTEALNGPDAVRIFEAGDWRPDLAVLDYNMPQMNGLETLRALRAFQPDLKALLCSGSIGPETVRESGLTRVELLPKPFRMAEMEAALRVMLGLEEPRSDAAI